MRHHNKVKKFNRSRSARVGLMKSLAVSFFQRERIVTTEAKAKALRPYAEKLISHARVESVAGTRFIISKIGDNVGSYKLRKEIGPRFKDQNGGYTRIMKMPKRAKDASPMATIELVK
jgi:large subunit ribosomal protein L17